MAELPATFSGDGWDECSTLIHNVRNAAWREGKIQDQTWMANLASILFLGEALAWYARLPRDVQEDWSKLQAALAYRWSTPEGESRCASCACSPSTGPQDAAAASEDAAAPDGTSGYLARGLLKAVDNGSGTTFYVKGGQNVTIFGLTQDVQQAARFRFEAQSSSTLFEFVNDGWYKWLAIHWRQNNPSFAPGSSNFGDMSTVDPETMKSSNGSSNSFQVMKFRFLSSGEVVPVVRNSKTEMDLTAFAGGSSLYLALDPEVYGKQYSSEKRLALYIQKIEE